MKHTLSVALPLLLWTAVAHAQTDASAAKDAAPAPTADVATPATPADASAPPVTVTDVSTSPAEPAAPAEPEAPVEPPKPPKEIGETISGLIAAIQGGHWTLVAAFIMMLLVWVVRLLWKAFPKKWTPWIAAIAGILIAVATALATGEGIGAAVIAGLTVALSSSGLWSLVNAVIKAKKKD